MMKHLIWSLTNRFLSQGFSALFTIILGNLLLPKELGIYVSLMMVVTYIISLFCIEMGAGAVQKLNDETLSGMGSHYFTAGWLCTITITTVLTTAMYIAKGPLIEAFNLAGQETLFLLMPPLAILMVSRQYFARIVQADLRLKAEAFVNMLATTVQIASSLLLLWAGYNLAGVIAGVYLGNATGMGGLGYLALKRYQFKRGKKLISVSKDLLKFSGLIHLGTIAVFLDRNVDSFLVNYFLSKDQLAIYNYASQLALIMLLFGNSISVVTFPKLTRAFSTAASDEAGIIYSLSLNFSFLILSLLSLFLVFHLEYIVRLILPSIYLNMIPPFTVLLFSVVLFGSFASVGTIFTARGIPGYGAFSTWAAFGINAILCVTLIPRFSILGAAIATSTSFLVRVGVGIILVEYKIKTGYNYTRLFMAYGLFVGAVTAGRFLLTALAFREIVLFSSAFFTTLLLIRKKEWNSLKQALKDALSRSGSP